MGKINMVRVILGGLLAGVVVNIGEYVFNELIIGKDWEAAMKALGKEPIGGSAIAYFVIAGFVLSILMIWLYAAIRPRFGAGPKTAICAGLTVWAFAYLYGAVGMTAMGLFPTNLLLWGTIWGFVELPIASVIGAWLYKEQE